MTYQPVLTDDGFEIRDAKGEIVWNTAAEWQYPPSEEALDAVFDDASISEPTRSALKVAFGLSDIKDERSNSD